MEEFLKKTQNPKLIVLSGLNKTTNTIFNDTHFQIGDLVFQKPVKFDLFLENKLLDFEDQFINQKISKESISKLNFLVDKNLRLLKYSEATTPLFGYSQYKENKKRYALTLTVDHKNLIIDESNDSFFPSRDEKDDFYFHRSFLERLYLTILLNFMIDLQITLGYDTNSDQKENQLIFKLTDKEKHWSKIDELFHYLSENKIIGKIDKRIFNSIFLGGESGQTINWLKSKVLLKKIFELLTDLKIVKRQGNIPFAKTLSNCFIVDGKLWHWENILKSYKQINHEDEKRTFSDVEKILFYD
jgi:hypothetical protein